jgi:hypothetical protein
VSLELADGGEELCGVAGQVVAVELQSIAIPFRRGNLHTGEQSVKKIL